MAAFRSGARCFAAIAPTVKSRIHPVRNRLLGTASVNAGEPWADDGFLTDYSKLQPIPDKEGKDFAYVAPKTFEVVGKYASVMLDQPEVFISPDSP